MNLFDHTNFDPVTKFGIFVVVFIPTMILAFYTIAKSQRLFEFLDAIANENQGVGARFRSFIDIWRRRRSP